MINASSRCAASGWDCGTSSAQLSPISGTGSVDQSRERVCRSQRSLRIKEQLSSLPFRARLRIPRARMPTITEDCIDGFQQYYARPPERPKKKSFKQMIYDSEDNSYFGRTIESWGELWVFGGGIGDLP